MSNAQNHAVESDYGTGKKTLKMYLTGFFLCVILTLIPFYAVIYKSLSHTQIFVIIFASAIIQFFVQVICFLRLNLQTDQGKLNALSFIFTIVVLGIIIGGSLWIMFHLNYNMMH